MLENADCCNEAHLVECQDAECHGTPSTTKPMAWQSNKEIRQALLSYLKTLLSGEINRM
jgi:hypothetical protein